MKKLLLMGCIILGAASASFAQGGGGRMQRTPEESTAALKTSLALTDAQATKVLAIYKAQAVSTDSLTKAANGDRTAMRAGRAPITAATNAKIKAVLTPDQAATYEKDMAARMQRGRGGAGGGGGTPPPPQR